MIKLRFGINAKLTLVFVLFAAGLLSVVSFLVFENARTSLQAATVSELLSTSIEKQSALNAWVADRAGDMVSMSTSSHLQEEVTSLIVTTDPAARQTAHDHVVKDLENWIGGAHNLRELLIIAPEDGRVIVATDASEEGKFKEDSPYFVNGKTTVYVQNPYYDLVFQGPTMTIAAPIWSGDGRLLAVLAGQLDLTEVNAIVNRRTGLHRTDDAFLVNTSNLFVTQPRLANDLSVLQRGIHTEAVDRCLARNSGTVTADDYRGIPALIAYRWLPERQLCLIVKIDQAEAFAPEQSLRDTILITSVIVLLLASAFAFGLARTITRPLRQMTTGATEIGKGNLEYRIKPQGRDEIGQLASAFNLMTANLGHAQGELRAWASELEQRVAERTAELSASEERYRILAETSPDMIFVIDREDQVQYVNTLAARQFGKTPEQVSGKPRTELFPPSIATGQGILMQQVLKTGEPQSSESPIAFTGVQLWLDTQLVPLRNAAGEVSAVMGVSRDITARKQTEEALARYAEDLARSNKELEQFAYVASHDLQEPLRMVSSYTQLLARRYKDQLDADANEFIGFAVDGANRMQRLINDLLAYSRVSTRGNAPEPTDCCSALGEARVNLSAALEESKAVVTNDDLPTVIVDKTQLIQLFQNLIGNAIKFRGDEPPRVHISAERKGKEWVFSIRDNGIGIDPQYFDRIFGVFQRLHTREEYPGTGIGLAICKRIVERHRGRIWIESAPGKGTTFFFTIPVISN